MNVESNQSSLNKTKTTTLLAMVVGSVIWDDAYMKMCEAFQGDVLVEQST